MRASLRRHRSSCPRRAATAAVSVPKGRCIFSSHVQELFLRPPLGNDDGHFLPLLLTQTALTAIQVLQGRHDDFGRNESPIAVILVNDGFHQERNVIITAVVQRKRLPSHELAHADRINLDACLPGLASQTDDVHITTSCINDVLLFLDDGNRFDLIAVHGSLFKFHSFGSVFHLLLQRLGNAVIPAFKDIQGLADADPVIGFGNIVNTGASQ